MNYTDLVEQIQDYTENREVSFVDNIPNFVRFAEERIYNSVFIPAVIKTATLTLTASNKYVSAPADWLATFSMALIDPATNAQTFLIEKDVNFIRECYPDPDTTGDPVYYAVYDVDSFIFGPTPDANDSVEIHYYFSPESIVTASTTWLGDNFETVLLYGALREAYLYMKGEADVIQYYEQKYAESLSLLKTLGEGKNRRDAFRSGLNRVPV